MPDKLSFFGVILSVQPCIRLLRSYDEVPRHYSG